MGKRNDILESVLKERERQVDLPGSEHDANNTPNDWIAIASYYLTQNTRRATMLTPPSSDEYKNDLTKAAAVILAALEHLDSMKDNKDLS
jgi:hypothetical protein|tara:strand:+ start:527 stop:796 length:270 start_codon:yes stop_codon:yes gene_type:complete